MELSSLLSGMEWLDVQGDLEGEVSSLCYDSTKCEPGSLFVALRGTQTDGHRYLADAVSRGARVVIHETPFVPPPGVAALRVADSRLSLAKISAGYFRNPSAGIALIGVTGTNGKTTVTYLLESILQAAGLKVGVMGTVNYRYDGRSFPAPHTTPESYEFQRILREMADRGVSHAIAEVSSHALALKRVDGADFDLAIFTNLSQDHLDYHQGMEGYFQAKKRLFSEVLPGGAKAARARGVVNGEDPWGRRLLTETLLPIVTYGMTDRSQVFAARYDLSLAGIAASIRGTFAPLEIQSSLTGKYNLENILAACAASQALGIEPRHIEEGIGALTKAPGRLERVSRADETTVFVDYAHTEDALLNVLSNLRQFRKGRIITVFGCGGDRDREKRPKMGAAATGLSDLTVVTSDNPRSEDPAKIIGQIEAGIDRGKIKKISPVEASSASPAYLVVQDRRQAIEWAINQAEAADIVLIAGKGHEDCQIIGRERFHFDDRLVAREVLDRRMRIAGGELSVHPGEEALSEPLPHLSVREILEATGGRLRQGDASGVFRGISTDSRTVLAGNLFIPLVGERFDGHAFIGQVVAAGAGGVLCREGAIKNPVATEAGAIIEVPDTLTALGDLANFWRMRLPVRVIAITGSAGKTTTKEMLAGILELARPTLKTSGNFNNLVGLPLTIFRLRAHHELAVLELGMNTRGEIRRLTRIAEPDIGLITNVGPAHLENLKSLEMIREEKGDLFRNMSSEGTAIINRDDEAVRIIERSWSGRRVTFSLAGEAEVTASDVLPAGNQGAEFLLRIGKEARRVKLSVPGMHNVRNALAAAACARACGIDLDLICRGLNGFVTGAGRFCVSPLESGSFLIDDCYNANPASMREALETISRLKGAHQAIAIMGDMLELGDESEGYHEEMGFFAGQRGLDALLLKGEFRCAVAAGASRGGMAPERVFFFDNPDEAVGQLKCLLRAGDWVLVKASRRMRLESVVEEIKTAYGVRRKA